MQVDKILLTRDHPEQFDSFFVRSFQWNHTIMTSSRVLKAYHFLKISANWDVYRFLGNRVRFFSVGPEY